MQVPPNRWTSLRGLLRLKLALFLRSSCHLGIANLARRSNERIVSLRRSKCIWAVVAFSSAALVVAADSTPKIGQGSTKQQVIEAFGPPIGHANLGKVEILHYRNGQVRLENGRVERLNLRPVSAPPAPAVQAPTTPAAPAPSKNSSTAVGDKDSTSPLADVWITRFDDAVRDASRRNSPILALFSHSDDSPASRQFQKEIIFHPEFVNAFRANYVLLYLDGSARSESPAATESPQALRDRLGVRTNPALQILSAGGEKIAAVEISDSVPGSRYRTRLIAAVMAAYTLPTPVAPKEEPKPVAVAPKPEAVPLAASPHIHVAPAEISAGLTSARWFVIGALCVGTLLSGAMLFVLWLVLRKLNKPVALTRRTSMASRIDHAASGLPSHAEILAWPKETLCNVVGRLAELEGYEAELTKRGEKDLILRRPAVPTPEAIVCCVSGNAGVIPTRRVRELVGVMAAEDIGGGWFVSPMGFSLDARAYAEEQNVRLIDGARLLTLLSDLPTFALPKVLAGAR